MSKDIEISFYTVRIDADTFANDKVRSWVESHLPDGPVLDVCAGESHTLFDHDQIITNDISAPDTDTTVDVRDLSSHFEAGQFDGVIYDPPWGPKLAERLYTGDFPGYHSAIKRELDAVLSDGGKLIQLGFTGVGLPPSWGYQRDAVAVFNQLGTQRDVIGLSDVHDGTTSPDTVSWPAKPTVTETVQMNGGRAATAGATEETTLHVHHPDRPLGDSPLDHAAVAQRVSSYLEGRTLVTLWTDRFPDHAHMKHYLVRNAGNLDGTDLAVYGSQRDPDTHIPVTDLSDGHFDGLFDTILFEPPDSYFSRCLYDDGENQGAVDSMAREAFDDLLCPGGTVVQIGHNATVMPGADGYVMDDVEVFLPQHEYDRGDERTPRATFLVASRKPGTRTPRGACRPPYYLPCKHCGDRFPAESQTYRHACPECGAPADSYCTNPDGQIIGLHEARRQLVADNHPHQQTCPAVDGTHTLAWPDWYHPLPGQC